MDWGRMINFTIIQNLLLFPSEGQMELYFQLTEIPSKIFHAVKISIGKIINKTKQQIC